MMPLSVRTPVHSSTSKSRPQLRAIKIWALLKAMHERQTKRAGRGTSEWEQERHSPGKRHVNRKKGFQKQQRTISPVPLLSLQPETSMWILEGEEQEEQQQKLARSCFSGSQLDTGRKWCEYWPCARARVINVSSRSLNHCNNTRRRLSILSYSELWHGTLYDESHNIFEYFLIVCREWGRRMWIGRGVQWRRKKKAIKSESYRKTIA